MLPYLMYLHRNFDFFSARDAEEREKWVNALEITILRHSSSGKVRPIRFLTSYTVLGVLDIGYCKSDASSM